jgi:prepilin-type N-terminal cleavage/methylation domain-containing protein
MTLSNKEAFLKTAFTLPEVLIAAVLVAVFFAAMFELNGVCLRYISASKESIGAIEGVHDRLERLRNVDFSTLATASSIKTLLAQAANSSPIVRRAVETVTIGSYPSGNPLITYTRAADGTVTCVPATIDFSNTNLVEVDVSSQWQSTFAGRTRIVRTSSIISAGTKK